MRLTWHYWCRRDLFGSCVWCVRPLWHGESELHTNLWATDQPVSYRPTSELKTNLWATDQPLSYRPTYELETNLWATDQPVSHRPTIIVRLKVDPWLNRIHFSLQLFYFPSRAFPHVPRELQSGGMKVSTDSSKPWVLFWPKLMELLSVTSQQLIYLQLDMMYWGKQRYKQNGNVHMWVKEH
jgi:hypothetical protein